MLSFKMKSYAIHKRRKFDPIIPILIIIQLHYSARKTQKLT